MVFPKTVWLVIAATLLISSIGFKKYVWFISLGYGFSIAGIGILLLALYGGRLTAGTAICCVLFVLYGFRLGGYLLLYREVKSSAYNSKMKTEIKDGKSMTFGVKCAIWVTCALLYALQVTPVFYRLANGAGTDAWCIVGAVIMLFGVCFESAADIQKQKLKKINPKRFCDTGPFPHRPLPELSRRDAVLDRAYSSRARTSCAAGSGCPPCSDISASCS